MKTLPTLKQLRHLTAVAKTNHFGRAADACFVTQSTLSASIKELENILQTILIERTKRSVRLTQLGLEIVDRANFILRDVEDIVDLAASMGKPLSGILRVGVIPTVGPYLLPHIMPKLKSEFPELKLYLREEKSADLILKLKNGELDVALIALPYRIPGLSSLTIFNDDFFVAAPSGHQILKNKIIDNESLVKQNLLLLEEGHCLRDHALSVCQFDVKNDAKERFKATSLTTLLQMVDNDLGITLLPEMAIKSGILNGTEVITRPLKHRVSRQIGLVWRHNSTRAKEFTLLAEFLKTTSE